MNRSKISLALALTLICAACGGGDSSSSSGSPPVTTPTTPPVVVRPVTGLTQAAALATFDKPWSVKVLPDGRFIVTERSDPGRMWLVSTTGATTAITGLPASIGMLDVTLAPDFSVSRRIYFTYMVRDTAATRLGRGKADPTLSPERMVAATATLADTGLAASLNAVTVIFQQDPTIVTFAGSGEPGGRLAFSPDGRYLYLTSGDRQELDGTYLQRTDFNIGTIVRIFPDGSIPSDNPFASTAGSKREVWTYGHRNHYGLAFTADGRLWSSEMGPLGGDELNLVLPGKNYGWPLASNGDNYDGSPIPDHAPGDGFEAPKISWTPTIAPAGMVVYSGDEFADWRGDLLLTGLQSKGIVRVRPSGAAASEVQRIDLGARIRDIAIGLNGSLWILQDGTGAGTGQLKRITPVF